MIYGGIIALNAQISAPSFYLIGCEVRTVVSIVTMQDTITVHNTGYEIYNGPASAVLTGLASIHLVNLSTITNKYFFLWLPPLRGPTMSRPQTAKGHGMGIVHKAVGGMWL